MIFAGTPATTTPAGTSSTTTAPAATTAPLPMRQPQHYSVSTDDNVVFHDDRLCTRRFDNACQNCARADVTVLANRRSAAQNGAHVDHGSFADDCADVDDSAHHNNGIVHDLNLVTDECARFDTSFDILHVRTRIAEFLQSFSTTKSSILSAFSARIGCTTAQSPKTILSPLPNT